MALECLNSQNQTSQNAKQAEKALKELKKVWGAFDKEFEEATKGIRKNI